MAGIPTAVLSVAAPYFSLQTCRTAALRGALERVTPFGRTTAVIPLLFSVFLTISACSFSM